MNGPNGPTGTVGPPGRIAPLPRAAEPFLTFVARLRAAGLPVSAEQSATWFEAVGLLGPRSMRDVHRAARAVLAPAPERFEDFDALFRLVFLGQSVAAQADGDDDDELKAFDARDGLDPLPHSDEVNEAGDTATGTEVLTRRGFGADRRDAALDWLRRHGAATLPRRRTLRRRASRHGDRWDLRRSLQDAVRRDGEILEIRRRRRTTRLRRIVLLIDVSGSMKAQTEESLHFAHALGQAVRQAGGRLETFTLGTRLTRVSRALRHRDAQRALDATAALVADWDGGTRLGDALAAFLAVPRFAGFTRSALVLVLSDGLERGDHAAMTEAVQRLSRLAWHLAWLTPLASDAAFVPRTGALQSVLPYLDGLGDGSDADALCRYVATLGDRNRRHRA